MNTLKKILLTCFSATLVANGMAISIDAMSNDEASPTIIIAELDNPDSYESQIAELFSNPNITDIVVMDSSLASLALSPSISNTITPFATSYYHYRVINAKKTGQVKGTSVLAKASGEPGITLTISKQTSVSASYSATVSIPSTYVTSGVGFNVTKSSNITVSGSTPVPKTHNGKKVKEMTLNAYALYDKYSYTVQRQHVKKQIKYDWKDWGNGTALKPIGVHFSKTYMY